MRENNENEPEKAYEACRLCPRECGVNRLHARGFCGCGQALKVARAALHFWEEPCLSGNGGSGAVFFSGCTLGCVFCQNREISRNGFGKEITVGRLAEIFRELEEQGAQNIDLITATQFLPQVKKALEIGKEKRTIPVVYNCGGYEKPEALRELEGLVDIYLPDMKYASTDRAARYSGAKDYPEKAMKALKEMIRQCPRPEYDENGAMIKGVLIRHLVMPGGREDSVRVLRLLKEELPPGSFRLSILRQFTPTAACENYPEINRRLTSFEYDRVIEEALSLGFTDAYMQEKSSAKEEYIPPFDLSGVEEIAREKQT